MKLPLISQRGIEHFPCKVRGIAPVVISSLEIGGTQFENVRGAIDPQSTAGDINVGTDLLRNFVLVIDYPQRAVWFSRRQ